ncbi:hypothetical protein FAI41_01285 [Acetobacteraceae bacterium]|nr:hypothetical protein FAI41_01285 [Acetobacteraceae bacterium]
MNFGELIGICLTIGGAVFALSQLVDEQYPFAGGIAAVGLMLSGLVLYYFSLKAHEHALALAFHFLRVSFV